MANSKMLLYPSEEDLLYEGEIVRNLFMIKRVYERALEELPGSYRLWHAYLGECLDLVRNLPITHPFYDDLNNTFRRALVTMHKEPMIWIMYLQTLMEQKLVTRTRRTFDRALRALPVTHHDRIWEPYLVFVSQKGVPIETSLSAHRRYLKHDPSHIEDFIDFLLNSNLWQEASEMLGSVLNDDHFCSKKGKTKHMLWWELCDLLVRHANEVSGWNVDAFIRREIRKSTDEVARLWTSLAEYYIRRGLHEKARDVFMDGMSTVITPEDLRVIFDSHSQFEQSLLDFKNDEEDYGDEENGVEEDEDICERFKGRPLDEDLDFEDIELLEESDSDDKVEIAQKDVPSAVFGGLITKRKRDENENNEEEADHENQLGALGRIKRLKPN